MYLKELDLQGFKSFPDKVKLEFNTGITAVVGPNGSGKSNISDSVRWVLGEQRVKNLRGGKMEDVIFAGTANRRPVGFAEVSMVIDNSDKKIPVEYSEIKITRRVYRSGESSYLINGTECRLKDIYELFMDTGIGRDGYSIIGQGKIDEILSNKSEDRRQLFEEAAGIVKYKNRKNEAEIKLEKEKQNLVRITDIIGEIENKLEPMEYQAEKAKNYIELYGKMKDTDIKLFKINGEKLENSISELEKVTKDAAKDISDEEKALSELKQQAEYLRENAENISLKLEQMNRQAAFLTGEIEKNSGTCTLTEEQIKNLESSVTRLKSEKVLKQEKIESNSAEIENLAVDLDKIQADIIEMKTLLADKEKSYNIMLEKQSQHEEKIESFKSEMIENIKKTADIKSIIERTDALTQQFDARKKQIETDKLDIESKLKDRKIQANSAEIIAEQSRDTSEEIKHEIAKFENKIAGINKVVSVINEGIAEKTRKLTERQSRLKILSDMEKEHDGYYKSVKAILKLKDDNNPSFKGIRGAIAQLFKTDNKYAIAIETALGGSIQSIVVNNENDAKTAVNYLKERSLGRATFLPISTVKGRTLLNDKEKLLKEKGVVAIAVDLVKFDDEYKEIADSLLGRIIVIDTMDNAIEFARKYKQSYRLVTLDGESFMPGGAITGGSTGRKDGGVFGRKGEMDNIKTECESLRLAFEGLTAEKNKNISNIEEIQEKIEELKEENKKVDIALITANQEIELINRESKQYEEKLRLAYIEEKQLDEQREGALKDNNKAKENLIEIERQIVELQNELNKYRESSESGKSGRENITEEITSLKVKISSVFERKQAVNNDINRLEDENKNIEKEKISISDEIEITLKQKEQKIKVAETAKRLTEESRIEKEKVLAEIDKVSDERKKESEKLTQCDEKINDCRETILKYKNELVRLESKSEKLSEERKRLNDDMWETYEITYPEAVKVEIEDEELSGLTTIARELKSKIKALGSVNVNAVEEYKEIKERYEFLTKQKNDIIEAEEKLKEIITELSELMENQFREKLEIISENFNEVFTEMFGGGRAYLKLSDKDDVLGSGIDIIAQPPGKNLQNMMLLSGGERALTAIAILFSILKMKPSPFCILDEIEAALDDANVQRFSDYLKVFSKDTQFIVITHRKGTMESADVLYGVTMQEQGVSKIVSVKFDET